MDKIAERKLQKRKERKIDRLLVVAGLLAFISYLYASGQYNITIVPFRYILIIATTGGLFFGGLTYKYKVKVTGNAFDALKNFIWTILIYGSICCALFFFINNRFSKSDKYKVETQILERHDEYRHSPRHVTVEIDGIKKDISFPNTNMAKINSSNFVVLTLRNGVFNFPVIDNKALK